MKINCDTSVQALANSAQYTPGGYIPQMDGIGDHYDDVSFMMLAVLFKIDLLQESTTIFRNYTTSI